jgi:hypothetical protein
MSDPSPTVAFPCPTLTLVVGEPTNDSLQKLCAELNANGIHLSHPTMVHGGDAIGHLALIQSPTEYLITSGGAVFLTPANPGDQPIHPANATAPVITTEGNCTFLSQQKEHHLFLAVKQACKRQLLITIHHIFIELLGDPTLDFATVTSVQLLQHLVATYGIIHPGKLNSNLLNLHHIWNPDNPIETVWTNIHNCCLLAITGNDVITKATAVHKTLTMFDKVGVFADADCDL